MDKMKIRGGRSLQGEIRASGAKNSALPILFSSLLADGEHVFDNVPDLADIHSTQELLRELGLKTELNKNTLHVQSVTSEKKQAPYDLVRKMRAGILCLGPLLARRGEAIVSLPGGCAIGTRPINLHLDAMQALGAEIKVENGFVLARAERLKGATVLFDSPTVGGTENLMMAASLAEGETVIENAAKEPEIIDLAHYLRAMGARISGEGSAIIRIHGVSSLKAQRHRIIPDRIEVGTLLIAGAITGGDVKVFDCRPGDLDALLAKLREAGLSLETGPDWIRVRPSEGLRGVDVTTAPHPGFPTDLQAQFMALMCQVDGTSVITETIFENRFMHIPELNRLGADITPKTRVAVVRGRRGCLQGAPVMATDLRASACLVLAGLAARGETIVNRIYHLDRGYEKMEVKLKSLGAQIDRVR
jgi:UDP-N-acetylglucosamine 1-carboxyvinyltransferase